MTHLTDAARETFWHDLIARSERRASAYCRRTRCSEGEIDEILWDLWQEATEHEEALAGSSDEWPLLQDLLRQICATRVRSWRRESRLNDNGYDVALTCDDERTGELHINDWMLRLIAQLPQQQRQAIDFRFRWGWPYWAVAAAIDTGESTARVHVVRGMRRLRELAKQNSQPAF